MKETNVFSFRVSDLDEGLNSFEMDVDSKTLGLSDYSFHNTLNCKAVFNKSGNRIDLNLDLCASIHLSCSKCGDPFVKTIETTMQITYLHQKHDIDHVPASDVEFYTDEIDISGIVRDAFLLAIPLAPLCKADCKGLCPSCGINLNRDKCDCENVKRESPFEDLRRLVDG